MIKKVWDRYSKNRTDVSVSRTLSDDRGGIAVLGAIVFPVVVGGLGLWVETGYWYLTQRHAQHIADVTAYSAGARLRAGDDIDAIRLAANHVAGASGLDSSELQVNIPPTSGALAGNPGAVEVIVRTRHDRWFTALFASGDVEVAGRAVVLIEGDEIACMLVLSRTAPRALSIAGSASVSLQNCDIVSNSGAADGLYQNGSLTAYCGYSVGGVVSSPSSLSLECDGLRANAAAGRDPYADVPQPEFNNVPCSPPPNTSPTTATTVSNPTGILRICNNWNLMGNVVFEPGLYVIDGSTFRSTGSNTYTVTGSGVTFLLANGADVRITGNALLELSAPTSGPLSGMLFFGDRTTTANHTINGSAGSSLNGAVYLPAGNLTYSGRSATVGGCTQIIASTITMTGSSQLSADCELAGTRELYSTERIRLIE
jgi:hypothetical protein